MALKRAKIVYTFEFEQRDDDGTFCGTVADAMLAATVFVRDGKMSAEASGRKAVYVLPHTNRVGAHVELREVWISWSAQIEDAKHGAPDNG